VASNLKISIDVLLQGAQEIKKLADAIDRLKGASVRLADGARVRSGATRTLALEEEKAARATLQHAQALARLQTAQGNSGRAIATLQGALAQTNQTTLAAIRGQIQLTNLQNNFANSSLIGAIRQIGFAFKGLAPGIGQTTQLLGQASSAATSASSAFASLGPAGVAVAGALVLIGVEIAAVTAGFKALSLGADVLIEIAKAGIQANASIETLRIGIAAVVSGVGEINRNGIALTGVEKFNAAMALANEQVQRLREEAAAFGLPIQETVEGFQTALGPLTRFGLTLDESRQTTLKIVLAMRALGIPLREIGQETRAILQGDTSRVARLNQILRVTKEELDAAKQRGEIQEFLTERLEAFGQAGEAFGRSFEGGIQRAQSAFTTFTRDVTAGLFDQLRDKISSVLDRLKQEGGLAGAFVGLSDTLTRIFDTLGLVATRLIDFIVAGVARISGFLDANREIIAGIIQALVEIGRDVARLIGDVLRLGANSDIWRTALIAVHRTLLGIIVTAAAIKDTIKLIGDAAVIVGGILVRVLLTPLKVAASLVATMLSIVPGLGSFARAVSNAINTAVGAADKAVVAAGRDFAATALNIGRSASESVKRINDAAASAGRRTTKKTADAIGLGFVGSPGRDDPQKKKRIAGIESTLKQVEDAKLALERAFAQRRLALARQEEDQQTAILERQLEDRQISVENFFREKALLIEESRVREIAAVNDEIAAERTRLVEIDAAETRQLATAKKAAERENIKNKATADRLRIQAQIVDLETKLNQVETKNAADAENNERRRIKAIRELKKEFEELSRVIIEGFGKRFENAIDEEVRIIEDRIRTLETALRADTVSIQNQVNQGLLSETDAREKILALEQAKRAEIEKELRLELARLKLLPDDAKGKQAAIADIKLRQAQLEALGVDSIFGEIRQGITRDLKGAFFDFLTSAENGIDALRDLAKGFVDSFRRAIAKILTEQIEKAVINPLVDKFLGLFGIDSVDPATIANTAATTANTAALTANTAALTGRGALGSIGNFQINPPQDILDAAAQQQQKSFTSQVAGFFDGLFDKLQGVFSKFGDFIGGIGSSLGSVLSKIGSAILSVIKSIGGVFGFAEGGYTGEGGKYEPAGIVHAGEYVMPQSSVREWGAGFFEAIRQGAITPQGVLSYLGSLSAYRPALPSYGSFAQGGLVAQAPQASGQSGASVRLVNVIDPAIAGEFIDSAAGEQVIVNRISRSPAKFRAALGIS
jgi:hypothetical protein